MILYVCMYCMYVCCVCSSRPTLCDPMDCNSPPGSSVHGLFQARILEWVAYPFSRGSSQPRNQIQVSCIAGRFFTVWATRQARRHVKCYKRTHLILATGHWSGHCFSPTSQMRRLKQSSQVTYKVIQLVELRVKPSNPQGPPSSTAPRKLRHGSLDLPSKWSL